MEYSARISESREITMDESTIRPSQELALTQFVANSPIRFTGSSNHQEFNIAPFVLNSSCGSLIPHFFDTTSAAVALRTFISVRRLVARRFYVKTAL